ncbi:MAG TPA: hypothetical protein VIJ52_08230 [Pseudolabrys sp.]
MSATLASLRCTCGSPDIVALRPGQDAERRGAVDLFTRLDPIVETGAPDMCWCRACWTARFGCEVAA